MVAAGLVLVLLAAPETSPAEAAGNETVEPEASESAASEMGDAASNDGPEVGEVAGDVAEELPEVAAPELPASVTPGPKSGTQGDLEERIKSSRRKRVRDAILDRPADAAEYGDAGVEPGADTLVGEMRPALLRPRWPGGALALGAFIGFGSGYYYAGVPRWGFVFTVVDAVLVAGFVTSTVMLNNLVVEHDFKQGKSLGRDERDFTRREQQWYAASIIFALAEVGSRAFQAFGSLRAARRTNTTLESFSFVPLGDGGAFELRFSW